MENEQNIFITGGNRGIGRGLVEQFYRNHNIIFSVRNEKIGQETIESLSESNAKFVVMDVDDSESVHKAVDKVKNIVGSIDILFNNAGILINGLQNDNTSLGTDEGSIMRTFNTNTLGVLRVIKGLVPMMNSGGRIINISSGMGQLEDMQGGHTAYRISKTALNALTIILSKELSAKNISVNSICPGWVKTDMGGPSADLTIEESTKKIVEFSLRKDFPSGKFLRHGEVIPW